MIVFYYFFSCISLIKKSMDIIFKALVGSRAYGLETENSDYDYVSVFLQSIDGLILGHKDFFKAKEEDYTGYELNKFMRLLSKNNPNCLELLWFDESFIEVKTESWDYLVKHRESFLSQKVKYSYLGYAKHRISRMKSRRQWLLNPPKTKPSPEDYGLENEFRVLSKEEQRAFLSFLYVIIRDNIEYLEPSNKLRNILLEEVDLKNIIFKDKPFILDKNADYIQLMTRSSSDFLKILNLTNKFNNDLNQWKAYRSWLENRNEDRALSEAKVQYDTKAASHAMRLLIQAKEILLLKKIIPHRKGIDRDYLLSIKEGSISYETLIAEFDTKLKEIESLKNNLPLECDNKLLNNLCLSIYKSNFSID